MDKSRYIIRQINLINLLLAGVLVLFIYMLFSLVNAAFEYSLPPAKSTSADIAEDGVKADESALPSPDYYIMITEQNLFHPDRKMVASAKEGAPVVRPDFVLYGTMITDDASIAFIDDLKAPRTTPGRGKRQRALRLGDKLSGYTLSEVYADGAVMLNGEDRIELAVIDPLKQRGSEMSTGAESTSPAGTGKANTKVRRTVPANPPSDRAAGPVSPGIDKESYINKMKSIIQNRGTKKE